MRHPEQTVVALVVTGFIIAAVFCVGWAAMQMDGRDWIWLTLFSASAALLIYGRGWLRALAGLKRGTGNAERGTAPHSELRAPSATHRPLILSLHDSGAITNGRAVHPIKQPINQPGHRPGATL